MKDNLLVSTWKSRNLSKMLLEALGKEHVTSGGTRTSWVGRIGALISGSSSTYSTGACCALGADPPDSNSNEIADSRLPSASDKYWAAVASPSPFVHQKQVMIEILNGFVNCKIIYITDM